MSDLVQELYLDLLGPILCQLYAQQDFSGSKLQMGACVNSLTRVLEVLADKTDERRMMRLYGTHGLTQ